MNIKKLEEIKLAIIEEEKKFLPELRELTYDGLNLEERAIESKKQSDSLKNNAIARQNKSLGVTEKELETYAENKEQLAVSIEKDLEMLALLKYLKEPRDYYQILIDNLKFETYTPLVVCANDYVTKELLEFDKQQNLKHFRISTANMYRNKLTDISIYAINYKHEIPSELSFMDLFEQNLTVSINKISSRYPERNWEDYQIYIDKINDNLRSIETFTKKRDSLSLTKLLIGKKRRNRLKSYYTTQILNDELGIYQNYSRILTIKESIDLDKIKADKENSAREQLEMKEELLIIQKFLKENLLFELDIIWAFLD